MMNGPYRMLIEYFLWPGDGLEMLSDAFVVSGCRIRLLGATVSVECTRSGAAEADSIIHRYVDLLKQGPFAVGRLVSPEQFARLPAQQVTIHAKTGKELQNARQFLRDARRSLVAPVHPRLSQCYDYFQLARDEPSNTLFHLYKLIETIESEYGGEREAIVALSDHDGVIKSLKRLANDSRHDQRHALSEPGTGQLLDERQFAAALESARILLTKYERAVASAP